VSGVYTLKLTVGDTGVQAAGVNLNAAQFDISWANSIDIGGEATITFDEGCCEAGIVGGNIHEKFHEIAIYRGDDQAQGNPPVLVGPVERFTTTDSSAQIFARSIDAWDEGQLMEVNQTTALLPVDQILQQLYTLAYATFDPSILPFLTIYPCATVAQRTISPSDLLSEHLSALIGTMVNKAVHGRQINYWCRGECLPGDNQINLAPTDYIETPALTRLGENIATQVAVRDNVVPHLVEQIVGGLGGQFPSVWPYRFAKVFEDTTSTNAGALSQAASEIQNNSRWRTEGDSDVRLDLTCQAADALPLSGIVPGVCGILNIAGCFKQQLRVQIRSVGADVIDGVEQAWLSFTQLPDV